LPLEDLHLVEWIKTLTSSVVLQEKILLNIKEKSKEFIQWIAKDNKNFIVHDMQAIYLQKHWVIECAAAKEIEKFFSFKANTPEIAPSIDLHPDQNVTLQKFLGHDLFLLLGGPGTGKTYTASHLVSAYLNMHPEAKVVAAAPTGKAAKNLEKALSRYPNIECTTLHRLLKIRTYLDCFDGESICDADLIVVDESSMMDAAIFCRLLTSIKKGGKLLLIGDPSQLPPVELGSLFSDLVDLAKRGACIGYAELTHCFRCDRKEILDLAEAAIREDEKALFAFKGFTPLDPHNFETILSECIELYLQKWCIFEENTDLKNSFVILSSIRKGPYGVDTINELVARKLFASVPFGKNWAVPILVTQNHAKLDLCNGDVGFLIHQKKNTYLPEKFGREDYVIFPSETGRRKIMALDMPAFEYAYALSIHKSQGSEYENVLLVVPEGSDMFGKEILYTAITRAKQKLLLLGNMESIQTAIKKRYRRYSQVIQRFEQEKKLC